MFQMDPTSIPTPPRLPDNLSDGSPYREESPERIVTLELEDDQEEIKPAIPIARTPDIENRLRESDMHASPMQQRQGSLESFVAMPAKLERIDSRRSLEGLSPEMLQRKLEASGVVIHKLESALRDAETKARINQQVLDEMAQGADTRVVTLENKLRDRETELKNTRAQLTELAEVKSHLLQQIERLSKTSNQPEESISKDELRAMKEELSHVREELNQSQNQRVSLNLKLSELTDDNAKLLSQVKVLQHLRDTLEFRIAELSQEHDTMEEKLEIAALDKQARLELNEKFNEVLSENQTLRSQIATLQKQALSGAAYDSFTTQTSFEMHESRDALDMNHEASMSPAGMHQFSVSDQTHLLRELREELQQEREKANQLKQELAECGGTMLAMSDMGNKLQLEVSKLKAELKKQEKQFEAEMKEKGELFKRAQADRIDLQHQVEAMQNQLEQLRKANHHTEYTAPVEAQP
eukprot:GILK01013487.1.p1 GENE.GILK01013487.1~~GILK01013487.1.p1  ORF type:complete len:468 (-),score=96.49 GILK01013487.1:299-1702(-)